MARKPDGGPAFPTAVRDYAITDSSQSSITPIQGMSLRDWFAGLAMQGIYHAGGWPADTTLSDIAEKAYRLADAMLKVREP